jgi:hypothetical protein
MKMIILISVLYLSGCAGWLQSAKGQAEPMGRCMSACATQCMLESAKELLVCPVPQNESK